MISITGIATGLTTLILFRSVLNEMPIQALIRLDECDPSDAAMVAEAYSGCTAALWETHDNIGQYVMDCMWKERNRYTDYALMGIGNSSVLESLLAREAAILEQVARCDGRVYRELAGDASLPLWETDDTDLLSWYKARVAQIGKTGVGMFSKHHMFILDDEGALMPIRHPDPQRLSELVGYTSERRQIVANTEAFLEGKPANNVLLYGDAGTGKSSTVKALANEYAERGLRLVELKKQQLPFIQPLMDRLAAEPLKFILFIDDLTFTANDTDFCALKAVLEGGVAGRGQNILVYTTSNHRHMVKETGADRVGEEISVNDQLQEIVSLSARFGLTVTFSRADKTRYRELVLGLAAQRGLDVEPDSFMVQAEAFALRSGGRKTRTARQFVDMAEGGMVTYRGKTES